MQIQISMTSHRPVRRNEQALCLPLTSLSIFYMIKKSILVWEKLRKCYCVAPLHVV